MKRVALAVSLALLAGSGASLRAQSISATTVFAVQHWTDAVIHHVPGEIDESVMSIVKMTMDDRKALNVGMAKFLGALGGNGRSNSTAEKRIVDIGLGLGENPGMNAFLERAAVLHGDAAMFGYGGPVVLPPEAEKKIPSTATAEVTLDRNLTARNAPPRDSGKIPPLLFEGYDAVENDGEIIGRTLQDWNWVFARALLDLLEPKHVDDRFVGAWYHATSAFMFGKRLIGEASKHLDRAVAFLPDDARILLDRACLTEMQGLPRSQQVLSNEDLVALRLSGQSGQQASGGLVRVGSGAQQTGRTMEVANAEAERLFRRALDQDPRLFEARLRLARLLILRTRYAEGLAILHAAPAGSAPSDKIGVFYVHLFSARAERALGHLDAAADHAREALALFPDAQSAMMASSQIAMLRADAAGAEAPLRHLATLPADTTKRLDPWWGYDLFTGRDPRPILREMWAQVAAGVARVKAERLLP